MQIGKWIFGIVLAVILVIAWLWSPVQPGSHLILTVTIQPGWGGGRIASELQKAGIIRSTTAFIIYTHITRTGDRLQAGTYQLSPGMSTAQVVRVIAAGQALSTDITVTIPEGTNAWEVDQILAASGLPIKKGEFSAHYRDQEGRLFPETYRFAKDASVVDVAKKMAAEFQTRARGYTVQQIIIASILEKEAKSADDMALVSGIIARRLAQKMPLQIDATVAYGWCLRRTPSGTDCDVTQAPIASEIRIDGSYNTYSRLGLPAGPISNPGIQALIAAAHPKDSPYLYYLSNRDGSQLIYAKTLSEQLANRRKYLGF